MKQPTPGESPMQEPAPPGKGPTRAATRDRPTFDEARDRMERVRSRGTPAPVAAVDNFLRDALGPYRYLRLLSKAVRLEEETFLDWMRGNERKVEVRKLGPWLDYARTPDEETEARATTPQPPPPDGDSPRTPNGHRGKGTLSAADLLRARPDVSPFRAALASHTHLPPECLEGANVVPKHARNGGLGLGFPPEGKSWAVHIRGIGANGEVLSEDEGEMRKWQWWSNEKGVTGEGKERGVGRSMYFPFPLDRFASDQPVFLTEGEGDAVTVAAVMRCPAIASTGAAGFPEDAGELLASLAEGRRVIAWPDPDEGGEQWMNILREITGGAAGFDYIPTADRWADPPAETPFDADARDAWLRFRGVTGGVPAEPREEIEPAMAAFRRRAIEAAHPFPPKKPLTPEEMAKKVQEAMDEHQRRNTWKRPAPSRSGWRSYTADELKDEITARWGADWLLTQKLGGKRKGKGIYQCPFHEDRKASLSLFKAGNHEGWKCHAAVCGKKGDLIDLWGLAFIGPDARKDEVYKALCEEIQGKR